MSTITNKALGHLFKYPDSLLNHRVLKDPEFLLKDLLRFHENPPTRKLVENPSGWIEDITGESWLENPSRVVEKLKAHSRLRSYVLI